MKQTENLLENENDEYDESKIKIRKEDVWWFSRRRTTTTYRSATCLGPNRSRRNKQFFKHRFLKSKKRKEISIEK